MKIEDFEKQKNNPFIDILLKTLLFFGFDRAVSYGVLARVWGVVAGPVTMIIIASRFSLDQQGFYYTFSSLLALQIFFELGLLYVIAQFASHEFVHLRWGLHGRIEGDPIAKERFTELLCNSAKWFGIASLFMILILIPAGLYFFRYGQNGQPDFVWRIPWILAVVGTGLNLLVTPFFAVIMGSGEVATVNHRELIGGIAGSIISWVVMGAHGGLFAVFAVTFGNIIISWSYLIRQKPELLKFVWTKLLNNTRLPREKAILSWWDEVWPMQWRMAISSGASYFIFQLFTPVLFHYHGAAVAGQMGMTLAAGNALLWSSMTMIVTKSPLFGKLIATRDWENLDRQFYRVSYQSITFVVVGASIGLSIIWFLQKNYQVGERFIPVSHAALLLGAVCVHVIIGGFVIYLRAHKREPLLGITVATSVIQGATVWLLGKWYSTFGVSLAYFTVTSFVILPAVFIVWKRCKKIWHTD